MRKILSGLIVLFIMSVSLCGCGSESKVADSGADYASVIEKFNEVFLPMDSDGKLYEDALAAVGSFISGDMSQGEVFCGSLLSPFGLYKEIYV